MSTTTDRGAAPAVRSKAPAPLERQERIELLLAQTLRRVVPIRKTFVQQGKGSETRPGPLAKFLTAHDDRGLEAYLLVHAMVSAEPWNCRLPSQAWVGALGLADTASMDSAKTAVSKIMRRLEDRKLITRVRSKRLSDVILLKEDGSGDPFERPLKGPEDWWLQLPHAYWLEGHYKVLRLPAKVMLLVALSRPDGFPLPYDRAANWYGVSSDSAEEGLRELRDTGLLNVERNWVKAPRSETGWTEQLTYTLQGSFCTAERTRASRIRSHATPVVDDQTVPVVRNPTVEEFLRIDKFFQDPA
ncbi:MAG: hypothetical protein ACRDRY_07150 [Pseudonocardiaceae bacterium]